MRFHALLLVVIISSIAAKAQEIKADYDSQTDFKKFKTYAWLAPGDSVFNRYRSEKLYGGYITYAGDLELKSRGLKIDTLRPDAVFVFDTMVKDFTKYTQGATLSIGVGVAGPGYYAAGSAPVAGGKITETTVTDGSYVIAMYDGQNGKLVWQCRAKKTFDMSDDIQKIIGDYTKRMFKKLPIKVK
jgi:hypothetical protein